MTVQRTTPSTLWLVLIVVGGATGLFHFVSNVRPYWSFKRAESVVLAKIVEAKPVPAGAEKGTPMFRARIVYQYRVGNDEHIGNMDAVNRKRRRRDLIMEALARYPVGSTIKVGVDPDDAAHSTPENSPPWYAWLQLVGGLAFVVLGGAPLARKVFRSGTSP